MQKNIRNIFIAFSIIGLFTGCEDYATKVDMPHVEKKIVVQSFISPDDTVVSALITWSKPIIGTKDWEDIELILNATVIISDGTKTEQLLWNDKNELYEIRASVFPIIAGKKYFLTVSVPDGNNVKSVCEVPFTKNTSLTLSRIDTNMVDYDVNVSFRYKDHEPGRNNYYRLIGKNDNNYQSFRGDGEYRIDSELDDNNIFKFSFYFGSNSQKVKAWILNCDYNYFQYHKTLIAAENNYGIFSEPSLIFSNVEGGLGCFGAYNSYEVEVDL